jgi:hypothetical protein
VTPLDTEAPRYEAINRLEDATKDLCLTARGAILVDAAYDRLRGARKALEAIEDERDSLRATLAASRGAGADLIDAVLVGALTSPEAHAAARTALEVALAERETLRDGAKHDADVTAECDRQSAELRRERDEARAEAAELRNEVKVRGEAILRERAEVERLTALLDHARLFLPFRDERAE